MFGNDLHAAAAGVGGGSGLSGTGIGGKSGLGGVADEATKAASGHGTDMGLDRLQLWLIPRSFVKEGVIFQDLFNALLAFAPSIAPIVQMLDGNKAHFAAIAA